MPTITVERKLLFHALDGTYNDDHEFEDMCLKFGIHLHVEYTKRTNEDDESLKKQQKAKLYEDKEYEIVYEIEVPANRYDLHCIDGLIQALRIHLGLEPSPCYKVVKMITEESMIRISVKEEALRMFPFVACAVLRDVTFDETRYNSVIKLQERLHEYICRGRTLAAIGIHDLGKIKGPFTFETMEPSKIKFLVPSTSSNPDPDPDPKLNSESQPIYALRDRASTLIKGYKKEPIMRRNFNSILERKSIPMICDVNRIPFSLPPFITSSHSAISLETKNIFFECIGKDLSAANIALNTMVTICSAFCEKKFEIEPVKVVVDNGDRESYTSPDLSSYEEIQKSPQIINYTESLSNVLECISITTFGKGNVCSAMLHDSPVTVFKAKKGGKLLSEVHILKSLMEWRKISVKKNEYHSIYLPVKGAGETDTNYYVITSKVETLQFNKAIDLLCKSSNNFQSRFIRLMESISACTMAKQSSITANGEMKQIYYIEAPEDNNFAPQTFIAKLGKAPYEFKDTSLEVTDDTSCKHAMHALIKKQGLSYMDKIDVLLIRSASNKESFLKHIGKHPTLRNGVGKGYFIRDALDLINSSANSALYYDRLLFNTVNSYHSTVGLGGQGGWDTINWEEKVTELDMQLCLNTNTYQKVDVWNPDSKSGGKWSNALREHIAKHNKEVDIHNITNQQNPRMKWINGSKDINLYRFLNFVRNVMSHHLDIISEDSMNKLLKIFDGALLPALYGVLISECLMS